MQPRYTLAYLVGLCFRVKDAVMHLADKMSGPSFRTSQRSHWKRLWHVTWFGFLNNCLIFLSFCLSVMSAFDLFDLASNSNSIRFRLRVQVIYWKLWNYVSVYEFMIYDSDSFHVPIAYNFSEQINSRSQAQTPFRPTCQLHQWSRTRTMKMHLVTMVWYSFTTFASTIKLHYVKSL